MPLPAPVEMTTDSNSISAAPLGWRKVRVVTPDAVMVAVVSLRTFPILSDEVAPMEARIVSWE